MPETKNHFKFWFGFKFWTRKVFFNSFFLFGKKNYFWHYFFSTFERRSGLLRHRQKTIPETKNHFKFRFGFKFWTRKVFLNSFFLFRKKKIFLALFFFLLLKDARVCCVTGRIQFQRLKISLNLDLAWNSGLGKFF